MIFESFFGSIFSTEILIQTTARKTILQMIS
jgi:hypothetical protein